MGSISDLRLTSGIAFVSALLLLCVLRAPGQTTPGPTSQIAGAGAQQARAIPTLIFAPGAAVTSSFAAGQIDQYRIKLEANYYVHFTAYFYDVNGVLSLYAPDGRKLEEVTLPTSTEALKELWWTTESAGDYRLEVRAADPKAAGKYDVYIRNLVPNDERNEKLIAADLLRAEGWRLHEIGTQEALRAAIPKLQAAVPLWREVGDQAYYFESAMILGEVYHNLSEYRKAIEVYETLFPLLDQAANSYPIKIDALWAYNNLASSYSALGEKERARQYYERALQYVQEEDAFLRRTRGHPMAPRGFAVVLTALGNINLQLGKKEKALEFFNQAIPYWNVARGGHRETFGLARTYRGLSQIYASLGDVEQAQALARQALQYSRDTLDLLGQVEALNILGVTNSAHDNYGEAAENFAEALSVSRLSGDRNGQSKALANLGYVYLSLSRFREAEDALNQALELLRDIGNRTGEARALTGLGMLARAQGDARQAVRLYEEALPLRRATKDREGEAETLYELARAHLELDDLTSARGEIEGALEQIEFVRAGYSGAEMRASYQATVQRYYEFYVNLLMLLHGRDPARGFDRMALERSELARARSLLESLRESGLDIRAGVEPQLLRRERQLQRLIQDKGDFQTRLLNRPATPEQKAAAEREIASLLDDYQQIEARIRAASPRYASLTQPKALGLRKIQQELLDQNSLLLEYSLGDERSYLWAVTPTAVQSFELPKRAEVEAAAARLYQSLTARNKREQAENPAQRSERLARAEAQYAEAAETLSRMLLGPVASQLEKRRLIIIPEGALAYVPFATLPVPPAGVQPASATGVAADANAPAPPPQRAASVPLIVEHEIVNLPSATVLAALRRETDGRQAAPGAVAVLADPVFAPDDARLRRNGSKPTRASDARQNVRAVDAERSALEVGAAGDDGRLPRLLFSRTEALNILSLVPAAERKRALDFEASKATATSPELGRYRVVHFATHALLNNRHPELSGIVLSLVDRQGRPQDGFLRLHDIYNLKLSADLVVLSACQSGLGKEIRGEGMISLTRGFMYAGAPRVVASLWKIDDRATAEFMRRFYGAMLGARRLRPAAALREAQIEMWRTGNWSDPYYWAAFVLQGEWR